MNINQLNQLIPDPYRAVNVSETFLYYRNENVYPISGAYIAQDGDFLFKYKKTNGMVEIEEVKSKDLPQTVITAEDWVQRYFTNLEVIALMRLEQAILSSGKLLGPKMEASKQWLEGMMFAQPSNNFPSAPYSYAEISAEASGILQS